MAVIGSTDLGDGRLALTVDVDPIASFPSEARVGDLINYDGQWYRAGSSSSAYPEFNVHAQLHQAGSIDEMNVAGLSGELVTPQTPKTHSTTHKHGGGDEVASATPGANVIPKAGGAGEVDKDFLPTMIASGASAAKGAVPTPPLVAGTAKFLREDATWQIPATGYTEATVQTTDATVTTIATIPITDLYTFMVKAQIVGRRVGAADAAAYIREAAFYRDGGGAVQVGPTNSPFTRETTAQYDATITASGNNAIITVKGQTGHTVNWKVRYTTVDVG